MQCLATPHRYRKLARTELSLMWFGELEIKPSIPFWALALERKRGTTRGKDKFFDLVWIRIHDLRIRSPLLYRLRYTSPEGARALIIKSYYKGFYSKIKKINVSHHALKHTGNSLACPAKLEENFTFLSVHDKRCQTDVTEKIVSLQGFVPGETWTLNLSPYFNTRTVAFPIRSVQVIKNHRT